MAKDKPMKIKIYFDGGCIPNPGSGYGSFECSGDGLFHRSVRLSLSPPGPQLQSQMTSNQAEYLTLIQALEWVLKNGTGDPADIELEIFSDSILVVNQLNGDWRIRKPHIRELSAAAARALAGFKSWRICWQGRENNVRRFGH